MIIRGTTALVAHIGFPTDGFVSPLIYNPFFEHAGIDAVVMPMGCRAEDYPAFLRAVFTLTNIRGALITMPHKVTTVELLDDVSSAVRIAGACNAVRRSSQGRLQGDLFDGEGFVQELRDELQAAGRGLDRALWVEKVVSGAATKEELVGWARQHYWGVTYHTRRFLSAAAR